MPAEPIILAPYDAQWPRLFEEEKQRIIDAIGPWLEAVEHVGSTAIPAIAAKPIIDICVGLRRDEDGEKTIAPLEAIGYEYLGEYGIRGRYYFRKRTGTPLPGQAHGGVGRTHQLHMYQVGHDEWDAHLAFREYLRAHREAAQEYEALKRELAARHDDVEDYANGKCDFLRTVLTAAGYDIRRKQWSDEMRGAAN